MNILKKVGSEFLELVNNLEESIDTKDINLKKTEVNNVLEIWEKNERTWIMVEYHEEINQIEDLLVDCYTYYLQGEKNEFEVSYRKLKRNIEDMQNRVKITFTNIL
ncbi:MAG: DUF4363 family protein [Agathobacter sp.]|nr:DUF4363 family protein [Agathobacter sp.]